MQAWAHTFTDLLSQYPGQAPYTDADYFAHIDGRPRAEGVATMLASRGIELPRGTPEDGPEEDTVHGVGNRKNLHFTATLEQGGIEPYPGSLALIRHLEQAGMPMAVVSSSRNAPAVLEAAGIAQHFAVVVDGASAARLGLPGKPAPDTFLWAAEHLGADPATSVVLEDAVSGVRAGAAGGFRQVIGVDRGVGAQTLRDAGAHLVVADLAELF